MAEVADAPTSPKDAVGGFMSNLVRDLPNPSLAAKPPEEGGEHGETTSKTTDAPPAPKPGDAAASSAADPKLPAAQLDESKWPRNAKDWKAFTKARDDGFAERDTKIKDLEARLAEAATKTPATLQVAETEEYKALVKERDEYSDRLKTVDVAQHPRFQQYFGERKTAQLELSKRIVGAEKADEVVRLLEMQDSDYKENQLNEIMGEMTPLKASQLGAVVNSLSVLEAERQSEIKKGRENFEKMQASQRAEAESVKTNIGKMVDSFVTKAQDNKNGHAAFQLRDGHDEWNASVGKRVEHFKNFFSNKLQPDVVFQTVLNGTAFPAVAAQVTYLMEENAKLKKQVEAMGTANPKVETSKPQDNLERETRFVIPPGSSPREATAGWLKNLPQPT